ncbi:MAG: histidine kinase [Acidobacteriota bacterium]|nr:histidine kinase [Acidobacteriota bacterium]
MSTSVMLGELFAIQEWVDMRMWSEPISLLLLMEAWGLQYLLWGVLCWVLWWRMGGLFQQATLRYILTRGLPISILACIVEEMIWVLCFPNLPLRHAHMPYWPRVMFYLDAELVNSLVIFWSAFFLFRGLGYYQQLREKDAAAAELKTQLAHAQVRALRMQLNPHFLFNTMNSISSLMQTDVSAADLMLEQLSSLLRITLKRGEVQLIPLSDEMDFIETYLAMQDLRFTGRIRQEITIEPDLLDALVPAMLLQPLVENAYTHGLSKLNCDGLIALSVRREQSTLKIGVFNSGVGMQLADSKSSERQGVGIANVKDRLRLHYGTDQTFCIEEIGLGNVQVTLTFPLQFAEHQIGTLTGYGV